MNGVIRRLRLASGLVMLAGMPKIENCNIYKSLMIVASERSAPGKQW
jgi:hypothetical protein